MYIYLIYNLEIIFRLSVILLAATSYKPLILHYVTKWYVVCVRIDFLTFLKGEGVRARARTRGRKNEKTHSETTETNDGSSGRPLMEYPKSVGKRWSSGVSLK